MKAEGYFVHLFKCLLVRVRYSLLIPLLAGRDEGKGDAKRIRRQEDEGKIPKRTT